MKAGICFRLLNSCCSPSCCKTKFEAATVVVGNAAVATVGVAAALRIGCLAGKAFIETGRIHDHATATFPHIGRALEGITEARGKTVAVVVVATAKAAAAVANAVAHNIGHTHRCGIAVCFARRLARNALVTLILVRQHARVALPIAGWLFEASSKAAEAQRNRATRWRWCCCGCYFCLWLGRLAGSTFLQLLLVAQHTCLALPFADGFLELIPKSSCYQWS